VAVTIWRFIHIYILYVVICSIFLITSYKIIRRDAKNRLNQLLSTFLILISFSMISNFIYASFSEPSLEPAAVLLHILSMYLISFSLAFLLLFNLTLYNPESSITKTSNQIIFLSLYSIISLVLFFIPNGIKIEILYDGTQSYPVWSFLFFLYYLIIFIPPMIYSLIICMKIYNKFSSKRLAKRMRLFILGILCFYYIGLMVCFTNYLNIDFLRNIFTLTGLLAIIGVFLIYFSVGKSLSQPYEL
jgi:hypothetical protein